MVVFRAARPGLLARRYSDAALVTQSGGRGSFTTCHAAVPVTFTGRAATPATPAPNAAAPRPAAPPRPVSPFPVKPVFVVSSDGTLHQLNLSNGEDMAPPAKFLPPNGKPYSLNMVDNVIYAATGQGCGGNPNGVWSIDLNTPEKKVESFARKPTTTQT